MKIIVPATSANLGAGFDSIGIAVNLYLTIELLEPAESWLIEHDFEGIPQDEHNLIIQTALELKEDLQPYHLKMSSEIPLEHGLGSSSSAIVAGIELANIVGKLHLTLEQKLELACKIEGHPDNVAPALLGGLVVASYDESGKLSYAKLPSPDCKLTATIPPYSVSTKKAREVLPESFSRPDAVLASSKANVLVASLATGDLKLAGQMMESDRFHEKYRAELIPELTKIRDFSREKGAYATYLSGAGSTIMTWSKEPLESELKQAFPGLLHQALKVDETGLKSL